jgi:hypothetical protein
MLNLSAALIFARIGISIKFVVTEYSFATPSKLVPVVLYPFWENISSGEKARPLTTGISTNTPAFKPGLNSVSKFLSFVLIILEKLTPHLIPNVCASAAPANSTLMAKTNTFFIMMFIYL